MESSLLTLSLAGGAGLTLFFLVMAMFWKEEDPVRARVESIRRGKGGDIPDLTLPFTERVLLPVIDNLASRVLTVMPGGLQAGIEQKLVLAGEPMNKAGYFLLTAGGTGLLGVLGFALVVAMGSGFGAQELLMVTALAAAGAALPYLWLNSRVRARQGAIIRSLPDAFDLITTSVEAGLGLDAALTRVAEKVTGPFALELHQTLREIGLGRMRRDALFDLGERTGVADLISFVNAVIQAEQMGTSIGQVLRVQADQMRVRRRQRAEEQAHQAPVKMVFPLVLCIFPTLFIVILGPAGMTLYDQFVK